MVRPGHNVEHHPAILVVLFQTHEESHHVHGLDRIPAKLHYKAAEKPPVDVMKNVDLVLVYRDEEAWVGHHGR